MNTRPLALSAALFCAAAAAAPLQGIHFQHKDWETACDNTGTCRIAGYQADTEHENPISVLLVRQAGEKRLDGRLQVQSDEAAAPPQITLLINGKPVGTLRQERGSNGDYILSPAQAAAVAAASKGHGKISVRHGQTVSVLSNAGAAAVWLKADEFQRFGQLKPQSAPVVRKAKTVSGSLKAAAAQEQNILSLLRARFDRDACPALHDADGKKELTLYRLDAKHVLAETLCWHAAYNLGYAYTVLDGAHKHIRQTVTTNGSFYQNGEIVSSHKDRGVGDCRSGETHVWDGRRFVKTADGSTGMCRGFAGGAWSLPLFRAEVK